MTGPEVISQLLQSRDSMTPDERREFLLSKNYRVATTSFVGSFGLPIYSMNDIGSRWFENDRNFYIDLQSGAWQQSGRTWDVWSAGPWFQSVDPFFDRCERSGIVWTGGKSEKGSRRGEFRGVPVIASEHARSLYVDDLDQLMGIGLFLQLMKDRQKPAETEQLQQEFRQVYEPDPKLIEIPAMKNETIKRKQSLLF